MATCNDCIHCDVCKSFSGVMMGNNAGKLCGGFADKSRFIELPCKVGDTVWVLSAADGVCRAMVTTVEFNFYTNPQIWISVKCYSEMFGEHLYSNRIDKALNKTIFFTREEAEAAILKKQEKTNEKR